MKPKWNIRWLLVSGLLCLALFIVIGILWSLYISGPARAYEHKIEQQEQMILQEHPQLQSLERQVFRYITYLGEDEQYYYWFSEEGKQIAMRSKESRSDAKALAAARKLGFAADRVELGYGYEGPAYVLRNAEAMMLLSYDDYEWLYEREVMQDE